MSREFTKTMRVYPRVPSVSRIRFEPTEIIACCRLSRKVDGLCTVCGRYCGPEEDVSQHAPVVER